MNLLDRHRRAELSLGGLTAAAREILSRAAAPDDRRVARFPDERTIRYYQSLGLVGRPLRYDGREAVFAYEHLVRVAAIKLLQNQGFSLAQIQSALWGASTEALEAAVLEAIAPRKEALALRKDARIAAAPAAVMRSRGPRSVVQAEVAPGVQVTIDPVLVPDPERVLRAIGAALAPRREGDAT